ncbi:MAG TPA: hypothetical protein VJ302_32035 [Blastocatellia bacterium]|nr:hypothetical protein [Blastocatellia bacterium]
MPIFKMMLVATLGLTVFAQETAKPRVFITDSQSWSMTGGSGGSVDGFGGRIGGGARPQTAEITKTFNDRCPEFMVTNRKDRADYVLVMEHEGGKQMWSKDTKYVIYNREGDGIESGSTRSVGTAIKETCAILKKAEHSRATKSESK